MTTLTDAMQAAEDRKTAALGEAEDDTVTLPSEFQRRAVFSGFDLDEEELKEVAARAGSYMAKLAAMSDMPLSQVFATCWTDAFLTGLMVNSVTKPTSE